MKWTIGEETSRFEARLLLFPLLGIGARSSGRKPYYNRKFQISFALTLGGYTDISNYSQSPSFLAFFFSYLDLLLVLDSVFLRHPHLVWMVSSCSHSYRKDNLFRHLKLFNIIMYCFLLDLTLSVPSPFHVFSFCFFLTFRLLRNIFLLYILVQNANKFRWRFSRRWLWRMVSSGLLRRVTLVRTDVSEEPGASFIRVTKIGKLGTSQAPTSNRRTLRSIFFAAYVGCSLELVLFLVHRFLSLWWRRQVPPKRRFLQEPHGVTTQKTPFFVEKHIWEKVETETKGRILDTLRL
jgi:hypothetical protein